MTMTSRNRRNFQVSCLSLRFSLRLPPGARQLHGQASRFRLPPGARQLHGRQLHGRQLHGRQRRPPQLQRLAASPTRLTTESGWSSAAVPRTRIHRPSDKASDT